MKDGSGKLNYTVKAKRRNTNEAWSDWSSWDDYEDAVASAEYCRKVGYDARLVDNKQAKEKANENKKIGRAKALTGKQTEWAYEMWKQGYLQDRICEALGVGKGTLWRALMGRPKVRFSKKPRIRTELVYEE